jgi:MFS family permease
MPALSQLYDKTPGTVQLTIVSFAVMFAVGQLFFGPFSERRGRRTALLLGAGLTLAGSAISVLADNIWTIIVGRAIQGGGSRACGGSSMLISRRQPTTNLLSRLSR